MYRATQVSIVFGVIISLILIVLIFVVIRLSKDDAESKSTDSGSLKTTGECSSKTLLYPGMSCKCPTDKPYASQIDPGDGAWCVSVKPSKSSEASEEGTAMQVTVDTSAQAFSSCPKHSPCTWHAR